MKTTTINALALFIAVTAPVAAHEDPVLRVIDGDTIKAAISVRLASVDTPETWRPKCEAERLAGEAATAFVRRTIAEAMKVKIRPPFKADRYGRLIASVEVDGKNLGALLVEAGHARPWTGKREERCE